MLKRIISIVLFGSLVGCANDPAENSSSAGSVQPVQRMLEHGSSSDGTQTVVRYGRYTLVSINPEAGQLDLMAQIVEMNIPTSIVAPTVGDAMRHLMSRSGYQLCESAMEEMPSLLTLPLAAWQHKLGPMTLHHALQTLAGPGWKTEVDELAREVCFHQRSGSDADKPSLK